MTLAGGCSSGGRPPASAASSIASAVDSEPSALCAPPFAAAPLGRRQHRRLVGRAGASRWRATSGAAGRLRPSAKISASSSALSVSLLEQLEDEVVEDVAVVVDDVPRLVVGGVDEPADLLVDDAGDLLGVVALVAHVAAEEHLALRLAELDGADPLAHAELGDHLAGHARWPSRCRSRRRWSGRGRRPPPRRGRRGRRRAGRGSRCGSWSTCRRSA